MATAIVSGRVDAAVKEQANARIRAAGTTVGEVIKTVWENIARTGEVPLPVQESAAEGPDPLDEFFAFCDELPPAFDWLIELDDARMNEMMAGRYA